MIEIGPAHSVPATPVRPWSITTWLLFSGTLAWISLALGACAKHEAPPSVVAVTPTPAQPTPTVVPTLPNAVRSIFGRWQREDGGYIIEIRDAAPNGALDARYFNPNPIRVSRAAWREGGGRVQLLVELNDVGYAGSTYVLYYEPTTERLIGEYTQPSLQQTFAIQFTRAKGP